MSADLATSKDELDSHVYCPTLDAWVPADQIGPDGQPLPLSEEVASEIRAIIERDLEEHPEARAIWIAEAVRLKRELEELGDIEVPSEARERIWRRIEAELERDEVGAA